MAKRRLDSNDLATILRNPHNRTVIERKRQKVKKKKTEESVEEVLKKCKLLDPKLSSEFTTFEQFPLSRKTLNGLAEAEFVNPTEIQRQTLAYSILGKDVVGAAKTGSGKTLALIIPLLECLFCNRWTNIDGLGALVICPTRELSYQIYQVLNVVGAFHEFSAALLIGGTNVEYEKKRLSTINIIICTPGRLLQHMDENVFFSCDQLKMLIIDEADRILDMGFRKQLDSIIQNLPMERQTLLFSATQTKKVEDLSRVSLKDPFVISVHENDLQATPDKLKQTYFVCEEYDKIKMLWSFLKNHQRKKTLIFVTCCKQARYLTDSFRHLKPGLSLMGLWGNMSQTRRMEMFQKFDTNTCGAAMIATDVASRGLDFQNVDWVLQLDCPADVNDYIHRVGRTARFENKGNAVLVLTPSQEEPFVNLLKDRRIPITKIDVDDRFVNDVQVKLSNLMIPFPQLKSFAQQSLVSYARAIYFMKLKSVFDVKTINFEELAKSYGLPIMPRIRFLKKQGLLPADNQHDFIPKQEKKNKEENVEEIILANGENLSSFRDVNGENNKWDSNADDDFLQISRRDVFNVLKGATVEDEIDARILRKDRVTTKQQLAKKILRRGIKLNKRIAFNEEDDDNVAEEKKNETESLNATESVSVDGNKDSERSASSS